MILAALLLFAQTSGAATPPADDVVVAAERLKRLRMVMRKDRKTGAMRCFVKRASGDPALDRGVCEAMLG